LNFPFDFHRWLRGVWSPKRLCSLNLSRDKSEISRVKYSRLRHRLRNVLDLTRAAGDKTIKAKKTWCGADKLARHFLDAQRRAEATSFRPPEVLSIAPLSIHNQKSRTCVCRPVISIILALPARITCVPLSLIWTFDRSLNSIDDSEISRWCNLLLLDSALFLPFSVAESRRCSAGKSNMD
jgi:hypothetical protein